MVFSGGPSSVCMEGSYQPIFGTNPLAIAMPTSNEPLVFDMATSAMAWFGLVEAKAAGRSIPDDVAYDSEGQPTMDPGKAMEGAIRPFDRAYKGGALSMMVDLLSGPLVGAAFTSARPMEEGGWGHLVLAIDPELLVDKEQFKKQVSEAISQVKATKKMPGVDEILVPGERGDRLLKQTESSGEIEIEDALWTGLKKSVEK